MKTKFYFFILILALLPACTDSDDSPPVQPDQFDVEFFIASDAGQKRKAGADRFYNSSLNDKISLKFENIADVQQITIDSSCSTKQGATHTRQVKIIEPQSSADGVFNLYNLIPIEMFHPKHFYQEKIHDNIHDGKSIYYVVNDDAIECTLDILTEKKELQLGQSTRKLDDLPVRIKNLLHYANFDPFKPREHMLQTGENIWLDKSKDKTLDGIFKTGRTHLICYELDKDGLLSHSRGIDLTLSSFQTEALFTKNLVDWCRIVSVNPEGTKTNISHIFKLRGGAKPVEVYFQQSRYAEIPIKQAGTLTLKNPNQFPIQVKIYGLDKSRLQAIPTFGISPGERGFGPIGYGKMVWEVDEDTKPFQKPLVGGFEFRIPALGQAEIHGNTNLCKFTGELEPHPDIGFNCIQSKKYKTFFSGYFTKFFHPPRIENFGISPKSVQIPTPIPAPKYEVKYYRWNLHNFRCNFFFNLGLYMTYDKKQDDFTGPDEARQEYNCKIGSIEEGS